MVKEMSTDDIQRRYELMQARSQMQAQNKTLSKVNTALMNMQRQKQMQNQSMRKVQQKTRVASSVRKLLGNVLPIPGAAVYGSSGAQSRARNTRVKPMGGRGRPKGAFDARYAKYGGVMNYRRLMARQAAYQRLVQAQQYAQQRPMTFRERIVASRQIPQQQQQAPQQYTQEGQQMPQEMAQIQPQPQYPQQMQQQMLDMQTVGMDRAGPAQRPIREIKPVFKSSGGSLGYAVNTRPMINNPRGSYFEEVDMMTGRRFLKRRPQAEGWLR